MAAPIINQAMTALRKFLLTLQAHELDEILNGTKKIIVTETDKKIKNKTPKIEDGITFDEIKTYPLKRDFWLTIAHVDETETLSTRSIRLMYIEKTYGYIMCDPKQFFRYVSIFEEYIKQFETFNHTKHICLEVK